MRTKDGLLKMEDVLLKSKDGPSLNRILVTHILTNVPKHSPTDTQTSDLDDYNKLNHRLSLEKKDGKASWGSHAGSVGYVQAFTLHIKWSKLNCIKWKVHHKRCENFLQNNHTDAITQLYLLALTPLCKNSEKVQCKQFWF